MAAFTVYYFGALVSVPLLLIVGDVPCGDGNRREKFGNMQIMVHALLWPVGVPLFVFAMRPRLCELRQKWRDEEEHTKTVRARRSAWDRAMGAMKRK